MQRCASAQAVISHADDLKSRSEPLFVVGLFLKEVREGAFITSDGSKFQSLAIRGKKVNFM